MPIFSLTRHPITACGWVYAPDGARFLLDSLRARQSPVTSVWSQGIARYEGVWNSARARQRVGPIPYLGAFSCGVVRKIPSAYFPSFRSHLKPSSGFIAYRPYAPSGPESGRTSLHPTFSHHAPLVSTSGPYRRSRYGASKQIPVKYPDRPCLSLPK